MMDAFPKIFAIGHDKIKSIFDDETEITEKIDGSQFGFGKISGELFLRSKGARLYPENPNQMFKDGVEYILSIQDRIPDNMLFYGEYLQRPKHNVLCYERIPKNHIMLFGCSSIGKTFFEDYREYAEKFDLESVPIIYKGKIDKAEQIVELLDRVSILGKEKIEGVVVKNYNRMVDIGGSIYLPIMAGKFVAERFKEVHQKNWKVENTGKGKFDLFKLGFQTEARWQKAVQHLRDSGLLENSPKDIGSLLKEVHRDIEEEEKENIMKFLWKFFGGDIKRTATKGLAEWYKDQLLKRSFE